MFVRLRTLPLDLHDQFAQRRVLVRVRLPVLKDVQQGSLQDVAGPDQAGFFVVVQEFSEVKNLFVREFVVFGDAPDQGDGLVLWTRRQVGRIGSRCETVGGGELQREAFSKPGLIARLRGEHLNEIHSSLSLLHLRLYRRTSSSKTMFSLSGKTAVITGGGSGIGQAISTVFAKAGARVEIIEMNEDTAKETVASIRNDGGIADYSLCDVSTEADVAKTIAAVIERSKRIDILVNNAGVASIGDAISTTEEEFDRIFSVNVKGVRNCLHLALPHMKEAGGGVVLNLASTVSLMAIDDRFAYSMSKGAVLTMTYSVARDFMNDGIRCNCICPARIHTPFVDGYLDKNYPDNREEMFEKLSVAQPIGRMGKPVEVAYAALFLCSDEASFITGNAYPVDGGTINIR